MNDLALLLAATLNAGTVLALAALGLLINERAGVVNLGAEGIMLCAAVAGFAAAVHTGSDVAAFGAGALARRGDGRRVWRCWWSSSTPTSTPPAWRWRLLGTGLSAFVGQPYTREALGHVAAPDLLGLGDVPFFGTVRSSTSTRWSGSRWRCGGAWRGGWRAATVGPGAAGGGGVTRIRSCLGLSGAAASAWRP